MSSFNRKILESYNGKNLRRVRIKVDPAANTEDYGNTLPYEGYILEEDNMGNAIVFVTNGDEETGSLMRVPYDEYEEDFMVDDDDHIFSRFKKYTIMYLLNNGYTDVCDGDIQKVNMTSDIFQLKIFLSQIGLDDKELLDVFCNFFNENE